MDSPRQPGVQRDPERLIATGSGAALDVRVALFTISEGRLRVWLDGETARTLPCGSIDSGQGLDLAARRLIHSEARLREQYMEQLYTLSAEDGAVWRVVVSYLALASNEGQGGASGGGGWVDASHLPPLGEIDEKVLGYALYRLRAKLAYTNIAFHLMPETFTLSELQQAYEIILGIALDKRNFRRRLAGSSILELTGEKRREGSHRPAQLYRFSAEHDQDSYLTPPWVEETM